MELQLGRSHVINGQVSWYTTFVMVVFHIGAIAALFWFGWKPFLLAVFLFCVAGGLGIGMCYHRLLTHRGYKTYRWLERSLAVCATLALQGGPIAWVSVHRIHHQNSDRDGDPHTPREGKWWSHMGWILCGEPLHHQTSELMRYTPDLARDPFYVWLNKWHWVPITVLGLGILAIGGLQYTLWAIFFRVVFGLHATWAVNSATHLWGSRRFITRDDSTNNFLVAMFTFGEGWHNNHHAHPVSARHGLAWYEIDFNYWGIWALKKLGLAWDVKTYDLHAGEMKTAAAREVAFAAAQRSAAPAPVHLEAVSEDAETGPARRGNKGPAELISA